MIEVYFYFLVSPKLTPRVGEQFHQSRHSEKRSVVALNWQSFIVGFESRSLHSIVPDTFLSTFQTSAYLFRIMQTRRLFFFKAKLRTM